MGSINIDKLNPHPKNSLYFTDISGSKYEEIKQSIDTYGIRDALKITTNYTIISGHQRHRIAKDLGFTEVPVEIVDVDEWQAEYMLIAENTERRGESENDPIKKGKIAAFLKEYWEIKNNRPKEEVGHNVQLKTMRDVAEAIDSDERTTRRLIKLNDLIPDIQQLVSSGLLGATAAEQLAYLTVEEQSILFEQKGESLGEMSVEEMRNLRKEVEILRKENDTLKDENKKLIDENSKLKSEEPKVVEKVIQKTVNVPTVDASKVRELVDKLDKEKQERIKAENTLKEYKEHTVKLKNELNDYKQTNPHENFSPQAQSYIKNHLGIAEDCMNLIKKVSLMAIMPPTDLPTHILEDYKKLFYETSNALTNAYEKLNQQRQYIDVE